MTKTNIYWFCQVFGWTSFGLLQIFLFSVAGEIDKFFVISQLIQVVFYILLTHLFRELVLRLGWLKFKWYSLIPRFIGGSFVLSIVHYLFIVGASWTTGDLNPSTDLNFLSIIASLLVSVAVLLFWSLLYLSFHYFERFNKSLQSEAALKEVELTNLKSQLNPHFIFNALNSIRALVDEDPSKSKNAITQLSNILRNSLSTERKKLVPFEEEIRTVRDYLELESIRYEERLNASIEIDPKSYDFYIPPLMIQTLVENGIKHGISTLKGGGMISIATAVDKNGLNIRIRNTGKFMNGKSSSIGYGLLNTRKRLELIYGENAKFNIGNDEDESVLTEITIPN